ncbi:MAG: TRAP transporter substrate-binding protein [Beijerinckiaceae bacterium]
MVHRRQFLKAAGAGLAMPALTRAAGAQTPEVTLRMHHFLPAVSNGHAKFLKPWADKVMAESGGRIKIDIYPSMQLGGTPPQLFDQARDGVVDLVWTLPGNTPGRFPAIESIELPFVAHKRAIVNSKAVAELGPPHFANDFREVKPICIWAHDHGLIHANKQVKTMEDLRGLKLRFPTRLAGEALKALGANAIGMPIPQVPEALAQRVLDGCVVPWEVVPAIKAQELVKFHTEIPGSPTLYTASFILAMNKAKYESLSPEARKILDANSGMAAAEMAGKVWDAEAVTVSNMVKARSGNTISLLDEAEAAKWRTTTRPVIDAWLKQMKEKGLDGDKILADLSAAIAKHSAGT